MASKSGLPGSGTLALVNPGRTAGAGHARERDLAWQVSQQAFDPELQRHGPVLQKQWQVAQEQ
jgi:hypothetical protein